MNFAEVAGTKYANADHKSLNFAQSYRPATRWLTASSKVFQGLINRSLFCPRAHAVENSVDDRFKAPANAAKNSPSFAPAMQDTFKHKGLRNKLVEELREKLAARGVEAESVLEAVNRVPRHWFIPDNAFVKFAYDDKAFPIGAGQTISQPFTVAFQTWCLDIKKGDHILEIGTGCGYQTAVLLELGAKVFSIERQKALYDRTRVLLPKMGYRARLMYGDGYIGQPAFAPFDKVIVTAGAPYVPEPLKEQLKIGGRLIIPVGAGEVQQMFLFQKQAENEYAQQELGDFRFVPMLNNKAWGN